MAHGPNILGCKKLCGAWISKIRIISLKPCMGQIKSRGYSWALVFVWWEKSTLPGHKMWGHVIYLRIGAWAMSQNIYIIYIYYIYSIYMVHLYIYRDYSIYIIIFIYLPWEKHVVTEGNPRRDNVQGQSGNKFQQGGAQPQKANPTERCTRWEPPTFQLHLQRLLQIGGLVRKSQGCSWCTIQRNIAV